MDYFSPQNFDSYGRLRPEKVPIAGRKTYIDAREFGTIGGMMREENKIDVEGVIKKRDERDKMYDADIINDKYESPAKVTRRISRM